jgi:putative transposase
MALARKSIKQRFDPSPRILDVMESFRKMTNDCIRIGMEIERREDGKAPSMKKLCLLSYGELRKRYGGYSQYSLNAISKAAGILSARSKSIKRGFPTRTPYLSKPVLVSCYGFKVERGNLIFHLDAETFESIPLSPYSRTILSDSSLKVRSFILSTQSMSLCVSKEIEEVEGESAGTIGVDRNLENLAVGNAQVVTYYDTRELVDIAERTRSITRSFRRSDARVRKKISSKYGRRKSAGTKQYLNLISKKVVQDAKANKQAIVFEDVTRINRLYRRGNGQARSYRFMMNSWPFYEIKRQVEYKAAWEGVQVITLTKSETRGTTMDCPRCGERLQVPIRGDEVHHRQLWCKVCKRWWDRDLCAVLNISRRGRLRFDRSQGKEGGAGEAVKGNAEHDGEPLILRVDASKLRQARQQTQ